MVILLLALIVLGPQRLPDAARSVGRFTAEIRRMSTAFRAEVQAAFEAEEAKAALQRSDPADDAIEAEARARGEALVAGSSPAPTDAPDATEIAEDPEGEPGPPDDEA